MFACILKCLYVVWLAQTLEAQDIREWRKFFPLNMLRTVVTDHTIKNVKDLAAKLRYTVSDMGSALALAEQHRLVRVGMSVSDPALSAKEKRPYSEDLGPRAHKIKADVWIGMATKSATARPYSPQEVAVFSSMVHISAFQDEIVDCFLLLSQGTQAALTDRVRMMLKQIELSRK